MTMSRRSGRAIWPAEAVWPDERLDRVIRDLIQDFFTDGSLSERARGTFANPLRLEEYVEDGQCVVRAELPGLDPEKDIEITVGNGVLQLSAHREERTEEERPDGYRTEFHYGSLRRTIRLPEGVTDSDVKASYTDGILEVRLPLPESSGPAKKVQVKRS